jgi:putative sigma-54 modulation protein
MKTKVTARHFDLTPEIKERAEEQIGSLTRYFDNIISAEFILDAEKHRRIAELNVKISNHSIMGNGETDDMIAAMDIATDKVVGQLKKVKGKMKGKNPEMINETTEALTRPNTTEIEE